MPLRKNVTPTPDDPPPGAIVPGGAKGIEGELAPLREMPNIWFKVRVWDKPEYESARNAADNFISNIKNGKYKGVPADSYEGALAIEEPNEGTSGYTATVWLRYTGTP